MQRSPRESARPSDQLLDQHRTVIDSLISEAVGDLAVGSSALPAHSDEPLSSETVWIAAHMLEGVAAAQTNGRRLRVRKVIQAFVLVVVFGSFGSVLLEFREIADVLNLLLGTSALTASWWIAMFTGRAFDALTRSAPASWLLWRPRRQGESGAAEVERLVARALLD
jgi:hypothetical protein